MHTCGGGSGGYCRAGIIRRLGGAIVEPMIRHTRRRRRRRRGIGMLHKDSDDDVGDRLFRAKTVIFFFIFFCYITLLLGTYLSIPITRHSDDDDDSEIIIILKTTIFCQFPHVYRYIYFIYSFFTHNTIVYNAQ